MSEIVFNSASVGNTTSVVLFATCDVAGGAFKSDARMPAFIPAGQAYYWSAVWQRDEAEVRAELEAGEFVEFGPDGDVTDPARWLLRDD